MKHIAKASIIILTASISFEAFGQASTSQPANTWGVLTALGTLGGIAAILTFIFAVNRDRQIKYAQMLFARLDEIQKAVASFIRANEQAHSRETLIGGLPERLRGQTGEDVDKFFREKSEKYLEDLKDAYAEGSSAAARIAMLLATSTSDARLNRDLSEKLLKALYEETPSSGTISAYAAGYVRAEADSILSELPSNRILRELARRLRKFKTLIS